MHSCCVFWPAFECCAYPKAGLNIFLPFSTFFLNFKHFCCVFQPAFGCCAHPKLVETFNFLFLWINHCKMFEMNKKGWKQPKKCSNRLWGAHSTWKLVEIHSTQYSTNAQQIWYTDDKLLWTLQILLTFGWFSSQPYLCDDFHWRWNIDKLSV